MVTFPTLVAFGFPPVTATMSNAIGLVPGSASGTWGYRRELKGQGPRLRPGMTIANRLWPLLLSTFAAGVIGFFAPQVAAVAAGFAIIWALAWRRQESAVAAIEERDAVRFYVDKTSPMSPIQLVRTPGFGGSFLPQP